MFQPFQQFQPFQLLPGRPQKEPIKAKDSRTLTSRYKHEREHRAKTPGHLTVADADPNNVSTKFLMLCEQQTMNNNQQCFNKVSNAV